MMPDAAVRIERRKGFPIAVVSFAEEVEVLSSCFYNGGIGKTRNLIIMQVDSEYFGIPEEDAKDALKHLGLPDDAVVFMTAAEVDRVLCDTTEKYGENTARAIATAGLSNQVKAGDELSDWDAKHEISKRRREAVLRHAGTINIIGISDVPLSDNAKANAIIAVTEAKSAAMHDLGFDETGTTSDAVAIVSPIGKDAVTYCGTGLGTGLALSRAVRASVRESLIKRGDFPYGMSDEEIGRLKVKYGE